MASIQQSLQNINRYQRHATLPMLRQQVSKLDPQSIGGVVHFATEAMKNMVQREMKRAGSRSSVPSDAEPRGAFDNEPELLVPTHGGEADGETLRTAMSLLSQKHAPQDLEAHARRWNAANLAAYGEAAQASTHQQDEADEEQAERLNDAAKATGQGLHGEAAVTMWMAELGNVKAENTQSATTQSAQLGIEMDQATQKASEAVNKEFQKIADDLKTNEEKIQFWKWADEVLNGVDASDGDVGGDIKLPDGGEVWFGIPEDGANTWRADGYLNVGKDSPLARAIVNAVKDFEKNNPEMVRRYANLLSPGDSSTMYDLAALRLMVSQAPDLTPVKDAVRHDTEQLEKMAEIVPSLYSLIDKSTYQAILESEDDALKQLDKLEQSDKSLSGAEKAVLEKQEAALKAQLTADFKINAHVDPSKVLEFGNLNELKLVEDVLKRTKEMAEKGELDGIDKSVIDAATKALAKQAHMLGALGHLHGIAEVTLIFGALGEVMERNNVTELNNGERLNLTMMKAQQKDMQKKSNDYEKAVQKAEEQQKKAEQMQKTMGCVGKILGWVVTAVSVAAAAFTGGASLALAGVGLALAAGDEICHAVTGKSFIDEAMKPMMDAVVKPIMNFVSKVATQALEACGVSKEKAEFAGAIIGAVVTGIAMVAVAVVGGSLVKSVASKVAGVVAEQVAKFMETSLGKMLKEALANLSEKVGFEEFSGKTAAAMGRMRKSLGITDENVEKLMTRGQQVNVAFNAGSTVAQGTMDVLTAKAELNVAKKKADLKMAEFDLSVLKQLMDSALQVFADRNKALASVMQDMVSANAVELTTGQAILKNLARSV